MSDNQNRKLGLLEILSLGTFFIFLTAKLAGWVTWSWWLVTAPLWIGGLVIVCVLSIFFVYWTVKGRHEENIREIREELEAEQQWESDIHGYGDDDITRH